MSILSNRPASTSEENSNPSEQLSFERIVFFTDAVFAIAITLLVLEIRRPEPVGNQTLADAIFQHSEDYLAYLVGFMVLSIYWINHHRLFGYVKRYDRGLIGRNLIFLLLVAFVPYPTSLLQERGNDPFAVALYAIIVAATSLMGLLLWSYAFANHRLVDPDVDKRVIVNFRTGSIFTIAVFLISVPIAFFIHPYAAMFFWILLFLDRPFMRLSLRSSNSK